MSRYEYKVVPAPAKGEKAKGVKTPHARFAHALENLMNQMATDGWEYLRADMLPSEERQGLTGTTTNWRNVLVFRRQQGGDEGALAPRETGTQSAPDASEPGFETRREPPAPLRPASGAERMLKDDGVEEISPVAGMTSALRARAAAKAADAD